MIPIEEEMRGKVAIVTGGNTGIGFGCAKVFCQAGMRVVIAARRKEKGEAAAAELNAMGKGECVFFQCDVSNPDQVKALVEFAVERYGRLDTMVNNAGYNPIHMDACDMSIESYQRVLGTNLMGEFYGCKFAIPHLRKTKGSIINMSSILSKVGQEQTAGYSSTKGGINSMTQTIAIEDRYNPKCRMTHMPKRYWENMTEFLEPALPNGEPRADTLFSSTNRERLC